MKVEIIALKNICEMKAGKSYEMYKDTADILVKHGKAQYKIDYMAEQREKKIVEPPKTKELLTDNQPKPKRKYNRRK